MRSLRWGRIRWMSPRGFIRAEVSSILPVLWPLWEPLLPNWLVSKNYFLFFSLSSGPLPPLASFPPSIDYWMVLRDFELNIIGGKWDYVRGDGEVEVIKWIFVLNTNEYLSLLFHFACVTRYCFEGTLWCIRIYTYHCPIITVLGREALDARCRGYPPSRIMNEIKLNFFCVLFSLVLGSCVGYDSWTCYGPC